MEKDEHIPKVLHFIWFGESEPNYVGFTMDAFRKVNPDFQIMFTRRTTSEILDIWEGRVENQQDAAIKRSM